MAHRGMEASERALAGERPPKHESKRNWRSSSVSPLGRGNGGIPDSGGERDASLFLVSKIVRRLVGEALDHRRISGWTRRLAEKTTVPSSAL